MIPWLGAFFFTQVVECPIYLLALKQRRGSWFLRLAIAFGASAITHPVVWFAIPWVWTALHRVGGYWTMVVVAELFAVVVEGIYLRLLHPVRSLSVALGWALGANLASVCLGFASRHYFGWP